MEVFTSPSQKGKKSHPQLGIHTLLCSQTSSVASPGGKSCHGDWKIPIRAYAPYLAMDTEDIPSKTPGKNPTKMPINFLYSRKASKEKCHNTLFSKMRSILKLLKETFYLVTVTTHDCEEYKPESNDDSKELFKQKKYFMYSVFNKRLQSEIGKTIVRKYAPSLDAQSVSRNFESHMSTSSKGLNERCRLHAYVSTTVYDKSWKGATEQFVLHFHAQFRKLDEVTPLDEHLPHTARLTLLQTPVRSVPELRIVETMEECMSLKQYSTGQYFLTYDKYLMMLKCLHQV